MPKPETDWNAEAKRAANHFAANHFQAHRGAMPWQALGVCVIFGNDGYSADDGRARNEVEFVRGVLALAKIPELGFAVADGGEDHTWAMIVQTDDHQAMTDLVWKAWAEACGEESINAPCRAVQQRIAEGQSKQAGNKPSASVN